MPVLDSLFADKQADRAGLTGPEDNIVHGGYHAAGVTLAVNTDWAALDARLGAWLRRRTGGAWALPSARFQHR